PPRRRAHGERRRLAPPPALERVARGDRRERIRVRERPDRITGRDGGSLLDYALRVAVPPLLQVGVDQVIPRVTTLVPQRVHLLLDLEPPGRGSRAGIRRDVVIPHPEAREDVRRHMLGMWHVGRDV